MIDNNKKTAIIMDEVDGSSSGEKGVIKELVQYIENAEKYSINSSLFSFTHCISFLFVKYNNNLYNLI